MFFQVDGIYVIDWYLFFHFFFRDYYNNFVSILCIRRQFLLQYCSWWSRLLLLFLSFHLKFFSFETCLSLFFLSSSIFSGLSGLLLINLIDLFTSSMCLAPLIWASFVEVESSKIFFTFFSKFCNRLYRIPRQCGNHIPSSKIS